MRNARSDTEGRRVRQSRACGLRRTAPFRRRAARFAFGQGRGVRRADNVRDANPEDAFAHILRRPRHYVNQGQARVTAGNYHVGYTRTQIRGYVQVRRRTG